MPTSTPRDEVKTIITTYLKNRLIDESSEEKKKEIRTINQMAAINAEVLLKNLEKDFLIKEVNDLIFNRCVNNLTKTTKLQRFFEGALILMTVVLTLLLGALSLDASILKPLFIGAFILCIFQIIFYVFLKFNASDGYNTKSSDIIR